MSYLAITIDLDGLIEYGNIFGLNVSTDDPHFMYHAPLRRFEELCQAVGAPGTVFAITRDISGVAAEKLAELHEKGFEIAYHSSLHDYQLSKREYNDVYHEFDDSKRVWQKELGITPIGFRAPGYNLSATIVQALQHNGFVYDSSIMPSPPYYLIRALMRLYLKLSSRNSSSINGSFLNTLSPVTPHLINNSHIVELPITVATPIRLPITGASLVLAPTIFRSLLVQSMSKHDVVIVNLHGMDLVDPNVDHIPAKIRNNQPELKIPLQQRLNILMNVFRTLAQNRKIVTCIEVARKYAF